METLSVKSSRKISSVAASTVAPSLVLTKSDSNKALSGHGSRRSSRQVWGKASERESSQADVMSSTSPNHRNRAASSNVTQLAKYAAHHLPHPDSRCTSRLVS